MDTLVTLLTKLSGSGLQELQVLHMYMYMFYAMDVYSLYAKFPSESSSYNVNYYDIRHTIYVSIIFFQHRKNIILSWKLPVVIVEDLLNMYRG